MPPKPQAAVLLIDVQERLFPAMDDREALKSVLLLLLRGAKILGLPILATEQYPKGLGATLLEIKAVLENATILEKTSFSASGAPGFWKELGALDTKFIAVCGIEAHVCVYQTVVDLIEKKYLVSVVENAVSSRFPSDRGIGLRRLSQLGAAMVSAEMFLFEVMGDARHPKFKEISALVKELAPKS
ncbi:MAG: isochorismatase family protein [Spirochaetia bacterium]|nr:isochorismatase family protein [Spirochaetia bacterium]